MTMNGRTTVLLVALSASLVGASASAQSPKASPTAQAKAADPAKKADGSKADPKPGEKPADKADSKADAKSDKGDGKGDPNAKDDKADAKGDKADAKGDKAADKPADAETAKKERDARKKTQRDAMRAKVATALKGQPMSEAMKQELTRHARRLARLERVRAVALSEKDDSTVERVTKLVTKENARHDKWMGNYDSKTDQKVGAK